MAAYHACLVFGVLGVAGQGNGDENLLDIPPDSEQPLHDLVDTFKDVTARNVLESFHDAQQAMDVAMTLFSSGYLSLDQRALAENLFWAICNKIQPLVGAARFRARRTGRARHAALRHVLLQLLAVPVDARQLGDQAALSRDADPSAGTSGRRGTPCSATSPAIATARSTSSSTAAT